MTEKVISINGDPIPDGKPNETCVEVLRELLEMAEAGEIVGFAGAVMYQDRLSSYRLAGFVGGYSLLGSIECAKTRLVDINMGKV